MRRLAFLLLLLPLPSCASIPEPIAQERARTPHGQATVVEFVDFECPFCREAHENLAPFLAKHRGEVRIARKHVPLTDMHPHAMRAALAAVCGEMQGKGDEIADLLFRAPLHELTEQGASAMAEKLGIDPEGLRVCMKEPAAKERIAADTATYRALGGGGVPAFWVEGQRFVGLQRPGVLEGAIEEAIARAR